MAKVKYYFSDSTFNENDEKFYSKYAKNRLISYHYKTSLYKYINIYRKFNNNILDVNNYNLLIDSGAYSIWNSGKPAIDVYDYRNFCVDLLNKVSDLNFKKIEFINLDVIPGQRNKLVTKDHIDYAQKKSLENYFILKESIPCLLPVFHQGDDFEYLKIIEQNTNRFCISPANDKSVKQRLFWIQDVFNKADCNFKPHGLGFSNATIAKANKWYSFDASTHALRAGYGVVMYPLKNKLIDIVFSTRRTPDQTGIHFKNFSEIEQKTILNNFLKINSTFTYENILNDGKVRRMINVYNVSKFYESFKSSQNFIQSSLF